MQNIQLISHLAEVENDSEIEFLDISLRKTTETSKTMFHRTQAQMEAYNIISTTQFHLKRMSFNLCTMEQKTIIQPEKN